MKATNEIDKIKDFLSQEPTHKLMLALHLGYSTTASIDQWFSRKKIPRLLKRKAMQFIERKTK